MRKICIVTGTRADYGLLQWLMKLIQDDRDLVLQTIATGMHLSPEFGLTFRNIEADGFFLDRKLEILTSSDSADGISKSIGLGMIAFADAFKELEPDIVVVLGDRFEILAATVAAMIAGVPIAHLHGGEKTEGAFDEAIRHSITKMSHMHFVSTKEYRNRVIQLGENPAYVFLTGGLGVDTIKRTNLLPLEELEEVLSFKFGSKNLLVTFHPVTLSEDNGVGQLDELLAALSFLTDTQIILTLPNADTGSREFIKKIEDFSSKHDNAKAFKSLGQKNYLSCLQFVDAVVGNSSSGLAEVPTFKKATINIGDRQKGRLKAKSVIDCTGSRDRILEALETIYSPSFKSVLDGVKNPYGDGGASELIRDILKEVDLSDITRKSFYDLDVSVIEKN